MATIDLGKIKLVWRGTYSGSTSYTVDDVVQHTDTITSSFICTTASTGNAPSTGGSVHSSWAYLAKGGVAGTDVGTTITTQGDILYRDGSGLQRLAKPASNKLLQNTSGGVLSWESVSSDVVKLATLNATSGATFDVNGYFTSDYKFYRLYFRGITSSGSGSKLYAQVLVGGSVDSGSSYATVASRTYTDTTPSNQEGYYGDSDSTNEWWFQQGDAMTDDLTEGGACGHVDIFDPLSTSKYKTVHWSYGHWCGGTEFQIQNGFGIYKNVNAISGFRLFLNASKTFANIDVSLYGYKN